MLEKDCFSTSPMKEKLLFSFPEVNKVINEIKDTLEEEKPIQEIIKTVKNKFLEIGRILMQKERCFVPQMHTSPRWIF
jgi:hypothetical protein